MSTTVAPETTAGYRPTSIEPGGIEAIPPSHRHGSPWQLLSTWSAPNFEFATVFVGMIAVVYFQLNFVEAMAAILLGNALGGISQGVLSTWGPREGLAQMVLGRTAFGLRGNILPSALNTVMAGLGWFATNSVSGTLALNALTGIPAWLCLIVIVVVEVLVAFVGHDLVQLFERYSSILLLVVFVIATVVVMGNTDLGTPVKNTMGVFAGFTLTASAAFGYSAGWNPYAADYSRYLRKDVSATSVGLAAGLGNFLSCTVLMAGGAAAALLAGSKFNFDNPTASYVSSMPEWIRDVTLIAIAIGAVSANALNVYSGAMSFLAAGVKIPFGLRRAIIALSFGIIGFFIALAAVLNNSFGSWYENFLLVIAYWIAPWLGIVLVDRWLRRGTAIAELVPDAAKYRNPAGLISFVVAMAVSIPLFSSQSFYTGPVATALPIGDLTPLVGFVLAAVLYLPLFAAFKPKLGGPVDQEPEVVIGVDAADAVA